MPAIEFDSIWALGMDCLCQSVVTQFAEEYIGVSPFAWSIVAQLDQVYNILTHQEFQTFTPQDFVLYKGIFQGTIDKRSGWWLNHVWTTKGWVNLTEELLEKNYASVLEKLTRRFKRILLELNDVEAKPLLVWIGYGPFIEPQLSMWRKVTAVDICGHWYDLDEAKAFLEKMRATYPADIRMVYISGTPDQAQCKTTYVGSHLVAAMVPITCAKRKAHEAEWTQIILHQLDIWKYLVKADTYEERLLKGWAHSSYRSCRILGGRGGCLTLNLATKTGHRHRETGEEFDILEYFDRAYVKIRWRENNKEETFYWGEKNFWKQRI